MEIMYFIIPVCIILASLFVAGFLWMTKDGQYDDLETPANRILLDDKNINPSIRLNKE
jgi:cbb3-type cytochrome oxidase maturation protein